jgi:hypothetical protein
VIKIMLAAALLLCVSACAARPDDANWGALSQQVGRQINPAPNR